MSKSDKYNFKERIKHIPKCSGVYCIYNKSNGKRYIGYSKNVYDRLRNHIGTLCREVCESTKWIRHTNEMILDWKQFENDFEYILLEKTSDRKREDYWTEYYKSDNSNFGYNRQVGYQSPDDIRTIRREVRTQYHRDHPDVIRGSNNMNSVLTDDSVRTIKSLLQENVSVKEISIRFGVCLNTVYSIKNNQTWSHI